MTSLKVLFILGCCMISGKTILGNPLDLIHHQKAIIEQAADQLSEKLIDLSPAETKKNFLHEKSKDNEVGYLRTKNDKGGDGYESYVSFHDKIGDNYGYQKHEEYGHSDKGENKNGKEGGSKGHTYQVVEHQDEGKKGGKKKTKPVSHSYKISSHIEHGDEKAVSDAIHDGEANAEYKTAGDDHGDFDHENYSSDEQSNDKIQEKNDEDELNDKENYQVSSERVAEEDNTEESESNDNNEKKADLKEDNDGEQDASYSTYITYGTNPLSRQSGNGNTHCTHGNQKSDYIAAPYTSDGSYSSYINFDDGTSTLQQLKKEQKEPEVDTPKFVSKKYKIKPVNDDVIKHITYAHEQGHIDKEGTDGSGASYEDHVDLHHPSLKSKLKKQNYKDDIKSKNNKLTKAGKLDEDSFGDDHDYTPIYKSAKLVNNGNSNGHDNGGGHAGNVGKLGYHSYIIHEIGKAKGNGDKARLFLIDEEDQADAIADEEEEESPAAPVKAVESDATESVDDDQSEDDGPVSEKQQQTESKEDTKEESEELDEYGGHNSPYKNIEDEETDEEKDIYEGIHKNILNLQAKKTAELNEEE